MKRYRLTLTAHSPVAVGEWMTSRSNVRESLDYIPGGVLRGALAQLILERLGNHNTSQRKLGGGSDTLTQAFDAVFGKDGAQFGFLTPFGEGWIPAPATSLFNKQGDECLYDTLFALIKGEPYAMQCPETGERLERGRGYLAPEQAGWRKAKPPAKTTYVRVGLNRATEAAEGGVLYAIEAVDVPIAFTGEVLLPTPACEQAFQQILDALRWRDGRIVLRVGSARSRGFGEVELQHEEADSAPSAMPLDDFAARAGMPIFTLLARTPAIIYDSCGMPAATLTPDILRTYLPDLPSSVQLLERATRIERELVSGWSGAWGMPKPVQQAIAPGSVFTYTYNTSERNAVEQCLQQLTMQSIGERTAEGYGQFVACSRYHLVSRHYTIQHSHREAITMSTTTQHRVELGELVRKAEEIVYDCFAQPDREAQESKDGETPGSTQLSNAIDAVIQSRSIEVFVNWLRYQMGRELSGSKRKKDSSKQERKFWCLEGKSKKMLGQQIYEYAEELRRRAPEHAVNNLTLFLGFLRRAFIARNLLRLIPAQVKEASNR